MRSGVLRLSLMAALLLAGCALVPSPYSLAPDGAKAFVLTMRAGAFSPNHLRDLQPSASATPQSSPEANPQSPY
jgi:hypothetical protein